MTEHQIMIALHACTALTGLTVGLLSAIAAIVAVLTHRGNIRKYFLRVIVQAIMIFGISIITPTAAEILTSGNGADPIPDYVSASIRIFLFGDAVILALIAVSVYVCCIKSKSKLLWSSQDSEKASDTELT